MRWGLYLRTCAHAVGSVPLEMCSYGGVCTSGHVLMRWGLYLWRCAHAVGSVPLEMCSCGGVCTSGDVLMRWGLYLRGHVLIRWGLYLWRCAHAGGRGRSGDRLLRLPVTVASGDISGDRLATSWRYDAARDRTLPSPVVDLRLILWSRSRALGLPEPVRDPTGHGRSRKVTTGHGVRDRSRVAQ